MSNNRPDNQADWISDLLSKDYLTDVHGKITGFILEEGNLDSRVDAHTYIATKIAEERLAEIKPTVEILRATYKSAVTQGLAGTMKWEISDMIDKLEARIAELEAGLGKIDG